MARRSPEKIVLRKIIVRVNIIIFVSSSEGESGEGWESELEAIDDDSLYIPTPDRPVEVNLYNKSKSCIYKGTSKSAEGYAARITFRRAKEEGMLVAVHWQDADSSSANTVSEVFPDTEIMICGGHAGRAHKKILELRQKMKTASKQNVG